MTATPGAHERSASPRSTAASIHWTQSRGAPAATAASRTTRAASALHRWAAGMEGEHDRVAGLERDQCLEDRGRRRVGHRRDRAHDTDRLGDLDDAVDLVTVHDPDAAQPGQAVRDVFGGEDVLDRLVLEHAASGLLDRQFGEAAVLAERRDGCLLDDVVDLLLVERGVGVQRAQRPATRRSTAGAVPSTGTSSCSASDGARVPVTVITSFPRVARTVRSTPSSFGGPGTGHSVRRPGWR